MLRNKKTKVLALVLSCVMLALVFVKYDPYRVGLYAASAHPLGNVTGRCLYHFFHAGVLHCVLNVWCFLSCVFLADVSFRRLCLAWVIACTAPALSATPTVGLSGVCFALLGMFMWQSADRRTYNVMIGVTVAAMIALCPKAVNNILHIYCYALGVVSVPAFNRMRRLRHEKA